jgi:hypothetical protein
MERDNATGLKCSCTLVHICGMHISRNLTSPRRPVSPHFPPQPRWALREHVAHSPTLICTWLVSVECL